MSGKKEKLITLKKIIEPQKNHWHSLNKTPQNSIFHDSSLNYLCQFLSAFIIIKKCNCNYNSHASDLERLKIQKQKKIKIKHVDV